MELLRLVLLQQGGTLITCKNHCGAYSLIPLLKREDYMKVSTMKKHPLQFCDTRWLEDIAVAERAIIIWPDIKVYITQIFAGPKF